MKLYKFFAFYPRTAVFADSGGNSEPQAANYAQKSLPFPHRMQEGEALVTAGLILALSGAACGKPGAFWNAPGLI